MRNHRLSILIVLGSLLLATIQPTTASADQLLIESDYQVGFSRDLFKHWIDEDGDGCDTRAEVLIDEAIVKPKIGKNCLLTGGKWVSPYDGKTTTKAIDLDIDHVVPLAEAWRSGAWRWTESQRQFYANDLSDPRALSAVSLTQNRSKGDRDVASWLPKKGVCSYITNWIAIKFRYSLTVDSAEASTLNRYLSSCSISNINVVILPEFVVSKTPSGESSQSPSASAAIKKMPELPKPVLKSISATSFEIEVAEIANWDFSLMKLTLNLIGTGIGDCKKETIIESFPFRLKCSGILANNVWIVSLQGNGAYGKVEPTIAFSEYLTFDSFQKISPSPTPSPSISTNPTPAATPESTTSSTVKRCWVNGYTRKNGTYVSGYWRSC